MEDNKDCPVSVVQKVIGGKWSILILYQLNTKIIRFGELDRLTPNMTQSTLTKELRRLENYQLVNRKVYAQVPPKVEYSLTKIGLELIPILKDLGQWGNKYIQYVRKQ